MDLMIVIGLLVFLVCVLIATLVMKNYDIAYRIIECIMDILRKEPELRELIDDRENMIMDALPDELKDAYERYIDTPDPKPKKKGKSKKKGKKPFKKDKDIITMTPEQWENAQEKPKTDKKEKEVKNESETPKEEKKVPKGKADDEPKDNPSTTDDLDEELKELENNLCP